METDVKREMLRHTLATLAYRGAKAVVDAPAQFGEFKVGEASRSPQEILAHVGDLLDWALSIAKGEQKWSNSAPLPWNDEVKRFFASLQALESYLASSAPIHATYEKLFQGPIADALTHVGQINYLRRLAGAAVRGENYYKADIGAGRVGEDQSKKRIEFD
jgi:hypothetical protein